MEQLLNVIDEENEDVLDSQRGGIHRSNPNKDDSSDTQQNRKFS